MPKIHLSSARIRQLRERAGLDPGQLAYKAGIDRATVYRIEAGERPNTSAVIVGQLAEALNTSTDYLLGRTGDPAPLANPTGASHAAREYAREILDIYVELEAIAPDFLPRAANALATQAQLLIIARETDQPDKKNDDQDELAKEPLGESL